MMTTPSPPEAAPALAVRFDERPTTHVANTKATSRVLVDRQVSVEDTDDHELLRLGFHHSNRGMWTQTEFYQAQDGSIAVAD